MPQPSAARLQGVSTPSTSVQSAPEPTVIALLHVVTLCVRSVLLNCSNNERVAAHNVERFPDECGSSVSFPHDPIRCG